MGLKSRLIVKMLQEQAKPLEQEMNARLGTAFEYVFDWACIPQDVDGWNWDDADLKACFKTSYFQAVEATLASMFREPGYREAITDQVKRIQVLPGRETAADFDFADGTLMVKNTMCANQLNGPQMYLDVAKSSLEKVINSKLG